MQNQVGHVRAERDILTESENPWIVMLYYTFQDERNLYMVYVPWGIHVILAVNLCYR